MPKLNERLRIKAHPCSNDTERIPLREYHAGDVIEDHASRLTMPHF